MSGIIVSQHKESMKTCLEKTQLGGRAVKAVEDTSPRD